MTVAAGALLARLVRQTVYRLSRENKQLERRFRKHAEAERAKNAPSREKWGVFCPGPRGKLIGALGVALWGVVSFSACVGSSSDKEDLKRYVSSRPPKAIAHPLVIDYDGKAALLGYKLEPESPKKGERVKLTMYWRLEKDLAPGWSLFTHVLDGSGERLLNIDNVGPLRQWKNQQQALPPGDWRVGNYYVDEQSFVVPAGITTSRATVAVGIWKADQRLKIIKGPHDSQNRGHVVAFEFEPERSKKRPRRTRVPELTVPKLGVGKSIKIDGKLDEAAWNQAARTGRLVNVATGEANKEFPVNAHVRLLYDDAALFVGFDVEDADVRGGFEKGSVDPHLWEKDTIEIMVDPDGDGDNKDYYEIQINPQNLVFDSRFDTYNQPRGSAQGPFGHQSWSARLKSAVTVNGTLDVASDRDQGYVVEAMIPWKAFGKAKTLPPKVGSEWRINFYAIQDNGGVAWSPVLGQGNFHKASRFGRVIWGVQRGAARPDLKLPRPTPARPLRVLPQGGAAVPAKGVASAAEGVGSAPEAQ